MSVSDLGSGRRLWGDRVTITACRQAEEGVAFRWDLITPDQLGSLLGGTTAPDLWFLDDLVACAGKVLAGSGSGDLVFVGRSLDSMFDLLGGALADCADGPQLRRLPLSFQRPGVGSWRQWRRRPLTPAEQRQARRMFAAVGVTPHELARRKRPVTFVDVVYRGSTFTELFDLLRAWIDDEREPWPVIRRKVRFVGVTRRLLVVNSARRRLLRLEPDGSLVQHAGLSGSRRSRGTTSSSTPVATPMSTTSASTFPAASSHRAWLHWSHRRATSTR